MSNKTKHSETPFFSIIIATRNCRPGLQSTMASILKQEFDDFECLIMDGASTDGTREYASSLAETDARILTWSEPDKGIYDAMNKGIHHARGKFLYFIGAGDHLRDHALDVVANHLSRQSQELPILLYGDVFWVSESYVYGGVSSRYRLAQFNISHQAIFYDRRIFAMLGDYTIAYRLYADWVINMKCFSNSGIAKVRIDSIIADYEGNGMSHHSSDPAFHRKRLYFFLRYLGIFAVIGLIWARLFELVSHGGWKSRTGSKSK